VVDGTVRVAGTCADLAGDAMILLLVLLGVAAWLNIGYWCARQFLCALERIWPGHLKLDDYLIATGMMLLGLLSVPAVLIMEKPPKEHANIVKGLARLFRIGGKV